MPFTRINYQELNSRQKEIYNFQKVAAALADFGYNCIKLADDWQGADFLAYHIDRSETLLVQLKGRCSINKKYLGKKLHIAFPLKGNWFVVPHDGLVSAAREVTAWLNTRSWIDHGNYHSGSPPAALLDRIANYKLVPLDNE